MSTNLQKLNKKELLEIIGKMKKTELINIINIKQNGGSNKRENSNLVKTKTSNAIRTLLPFNPELLESKQNNNNNNSTVMKNNSIYNSTYNELNKK